MVLLCILQYCTIVQCVVLYFGKSMWPLAKLCVWGGGG